MRKSIEEKGYNLNDFKGERISEALELISIIKELSANTELNRFFYKIKQLCKKSLLILSEEVERIDNRIEELNDRLVNLQPECDRLTELNNKYKATKNEIYDVLEEEEYHIDYKKHGPIKDYCSNYYPLFSSFVHEYNTFFSEYEKIEKELKAKKRLKIMVLAYIDKIEDNIGTKDNALIDEISKKESK